jgi:potassium/sodium efflux P-type ATPase
MLLKMNANKTEWYKTPVDETFSILASGSMGLSDVEAKNRLGRYGYNELVFKKRSALIRLLAQFRDPLVYVLLITSFVTTILKEWPETIVILLCVILNAVIGFIQEGKAESSIDALRKMMVLECLCLRNGQKKSIAARELVPGDIVILESGNKIPADLRLFSAKNFAVDESLLTGESVPANKDIGPIHADNLSPADQRCMVFSGTFVSRGAAQGIVVATGEETEFGKIAKFMKETTKITTPLMRKIAEFTRFLMIAIAILAVLNFLLALLFKYTIIYAFLASVSLVVAAIPEMLPAVIVAILALASVSMAKRNALIRRLPAAETLGCTTVICSDKTGTLTKNEMTVTKIYSGRRSYRLEGIGYDPNGRFILNDEAINAINEPRELIETLRAGYFCNNAALSEDGGRSTIVGDPTEKALVISALKGGIAKRTRILDEIPFESEHQYMATLHRFENENIIYIKGSPERILGLCRDQLIDGAVLPPETAKTLSVVDEMAAEALRVLGMAYKIVPKDKAAVTADDMKDFTFLGLQGMIDPPREEVIQAISKCKRSGIRVVMMTGDHAGTAKAIAGQIGIIKGAEGAITGEELSVMSDEDLYEAVQRVSVFARIAPEHKLRITLQLQKRGDVVAVTGDGVNDAPALKAADIGIAMGVTGTEVSKEASDMVLADDNFATIVAAVEEGRHAWKNFQKAVIYTLPTNIGQALLIMGAIMLAPIIPLFTVRLPLEPIHILWINLADSVFLTIPLMMEPKEKDLLEGPPRDIKEKIANGLFITRVSIVSILMAATGFWIYYHFSAPAFSADPDYSTILTQAQTAAFVGAQLFLLGYLVTARSIYGSAFTFSPFSNKWLLAGIAVTLATIFLIVYTPFGNALFKTAPFPGQWWTIIILALFPGFVVTEIEKVIERRNIAA